AVRSHLRDDLDADELRQGVAEHLGGDEDDLVVDAGERCAGVGAGGERLAEGVHAEVRAEGGDDGPGGHGQPAILPTDALSHGTPPSRPSHLAGSRVSSRYLT